MPTMILQDGECKRGMHYECDYPACIHLKNGRFIVCPHLRGTLIRTSEWRLCEECGNELRQKFEWEGKRLCLRCYREKVAEYHREEAEKAGGEL